MTELTEKLDEIAGRLIQGNLTPDEILNYRTFLAGWFYRLNESFGEVCSFGAEWKTAKREERAEGEKPKSEAELERLWLAGPGKKETTLKHRLRGIEGMQEVLTSLYFQTNKEMQMANRD